MSRVNENIWTSREVKADGAGFELRGRRIQPNLHSDDNTIATRMISRQKKLGQFFTPEAVASALVNWAVRKAQDRLLDPSCGDGQFLAYHRRAVGIEPTAKAVHLSTATRSISCGTIRTFFPALIP